MSLLHNFGTGTPVRSRPPGIYPTFGERAVSQCFSSARDAARNYAKSSVCRGTLVVPRALVSYWRLVFSTKRVTTSRVFTSRCAEHRRERRRFTAELFRWDNDRREGNRVSFMRFFPNCQTLFSVKLLLWE